MKRFLHAGFVLFLIPLLAPEPGLAHGGVYTGPGSSVPPGGAPSGPSTPGPSTPAGPSTGGGGASGDLTSWQLWWSFNRDPFLNLKLALRRGRLVSANDEFFAGDARDANIDDPSVPNALVRERVVPALLNVLEKDGGPDTLTGALLALGKIGEDESGEGRTSLRERMLPLLRHVNQEVAETAAISLGVLAHEAAAPLLVQLLEDSKEGRESVARPEVPYRTRAFAAYGLGLIGNRAARQDVRRYVVHHLARALDSDHSAARDVKVACAIALGLVRLDLGAEGSAADEAVAPPSASRQAHARYMLQWFEERKNPDVVRAYLPLGLARLAQELGAPFRDELKTLFCAVLDARSSEAPVVQQSAAIALGLLADNDADALDRRCRACLERTVDSGDRLARRLALVSLARVSARSTPANAGDEGLIDGRNFFLAQLKNGTTPVRPWAALALALLERARMDAGAAPAPEVRDALRKASAEHTQGTEAGAYCLALGLVREIDARESILARLADSQDTDLRAHAAIALGLIGDVRSVPALRAVVKESKYRPALLRDASIALGMLGDREIVPVLLDMLKDAQGLASQAAIASALGFIGDVRAIDPLLTVITEDRYNERAHAFAAVALGITCDKEVFPWNSKIAVDVNYWIPPASLYDPGTGSGILDLL